MKYLLLFFIACSALTVNAQQTALPHGMVYGIKPDTSNILHATQVESFMGKKVRISTTLRGNVLRVTRQKGGWFELDAGKGKVIAAHFTDYKVNIPVGLKGKTVLIQGVAQKQFTADNGQHFAGDTTAGKPKLPVRTKPKHNLVFEVSGLMVEQ